MVRPLALLLNLLALALLQGVCGERPSPYGHIIGIDLGSTYSSAAIKRGSDGPIELIPNEDGHKSMPSWVSFLASGNVVGKGAKESLPDNLAHSTSYPKHLLGRELDYTSPELSGWSAISQSQGAITPHHISTAILSKLKANAEAYLGEAVTHAVIAVPPYFDDVQRQATNQVANAAGLRPLSIINDSVAAIIAYDLHTLHSRPYALVYDFGGDAFTVTVNRLEDDASITMLELQTNRQFSSSKIDDVIAAHFTKEYEGQSDKNVTTNPRAMARLRLEAERLKIRMDTNVKARLIVEDFIDGETLVNSLTRNTFDYITAEIVWGTVQLMETALKTANYSETKEGMLENVEVILVGGSSRIPKSKHLLEDYFGRKEFRNSIDVNEVVAYGAAKYAASFYTPDTPSGTKPSSPIEFDLKQKPSQWLVMQKEGGNDNHKRQYIQAWFSAVLSELDSAGKSLGITLNSDEKASLRSAVENAMRWVSENEHLSPHDLLERVTEVQDLMNKLEHRSQRHDEL